ncbi:MAG TPA: alpha/beta hydrolase [Stellaceae bacterium]|jgi:pimeloyl-ACP methyl ester carboxylesterase|nr:alpha/beta hydrolase [Stellaceae bacterium]
MERIEVGGISLEAWVGGSGPPLLFLHGGDYWLQNRACLDRLTQRFRVVAPRHPGFGSSPRPSWFRTVHDIAYLYLDLIDRLALDRPLVVGSSLGGWIALEMAVRDPGRIGRLVLIDSVGVKFGARDERDFADIYALPADEVLRRTFADPTAAPDYTKLSDTELEDIARDRQATALYGWKPYLHDPALGHWLHRVKAAALVLWGEQDGIAPPAYGERLAAALPNARFTGIAAAGHYPQIEQPQAVADAITRFAQENRP